MGKSSWVRKLKVSNEVGFIMLQETQFQSLEGVDVSRLWGSGEFEFEYVDATGRSGGLISIWNPKVFVKTSIFKSRSMLVVSGYMKHDGQKVSYVNVYCPQKLVDKRVVWDAIKAIDMDDNGYWIVAGDFNSVRDRSDRRNSKFKEADTKEFNEFLEDAGLYEYSLRGRKFTFLAGNKLSRIDRVFVCWTFFNKWPNAEYRVLDRDESDHCPLLLKIESRNFGPKPFRFFNSWLSREGLDQVVEDALSSSNFDGAPDVKLLSKFRKLRSSIQDWHKDQLDIEVEEEIGLKDEIVEIELLMENRDLTEEEGWVLEEATKRLKELEAYKVRDLEQKARVKWAKEGDENSRFFHGIINARRVSNSIPGLSINGEWVKKPKEIKREVHQFFKEKFVEEIKDRPSLLVYGLKTLDSEAADGLVAPFLEKEIKDAVFECGSDKAPGPNGFNFRFIKKFWSLFSGDFLDIFNNFAETGVISRGVGSSFITLVPKVNDPVDLGEYRPINLIGVVSKVISKVLANRLKKVIDSLISETQSAFVAGRYILDGPLIISEVLSFARRCGKELFMFKIDFAKAYDNVNWAFVILVMRQMNFPEIWCNWTKGVLESARSSVLVNGSPTFEFSCEKGMRQGYQWS